jgi:hypothetical protein
MKLENIFEYELWNISNDLNLFILKNDVYYKTLIKENNSKKLFSCKASNPIQANLLRDSFLGKTINDNEYEIWVNLLDENREYDCIKILLPTSRPKNFFLDLDKFKCVKIIQADNDSTGISLCKNYINSIQH